MEGVWFASYVALWFVVALEGLMLMVALRQISMLLVGRGTRAARAFDIGPKVGEKFPEVIRKDLEGQLVTLGATTQYDTLLILISAGCTTCRSLMPGIAVLAANRKKEDMEIVLMAIKNQWPSRRIKGVRYVVFPDFENVLKIKVTPFAVLINKQGVVLTKGLVNDIQHLESLLNARDMGAPTEEDLAAAELVEKNGLKEKENLSEQKQEKSSEAQEEAVTA